MARIHVKMTLEARICSYSCVNLEGGNLASGRGKQISR